MKALTIWQPWCSLIMIGAKPFEFRRWDYRERDAGLQGQRIVIHAGARPIKPVEIRDLIERVSVYQGVGTGMRGPIALPLLHRIEQASKCRGVVPLACALGTAVIGTPRRCTELFKGKVADSDRIDQHMWAWPLTDIVKFTEPVPLRGLQGFWTYPMKVAA